jgi:dipeptidyl-peptidase-3
VLNAQAPSEVITFLTNPDLDLFKKWRGPAFEVQVGIHELLGHGSGKLFEEVKGHYNFDHADPPVNPLSGKPIESWYEGGQTYSSKFGSIASSYEECRAEACGIFLSTDLEILKVRFEDAYVRDTPSIRKFNDFLRSLDTPTPKQKT